MQLESVAKYQVFELNCEQAIVSIMFLVLSRIYRGSNGHSVFIKDPFIIRSEYFLTFYYTVVEIWPLKEKIKSLNPAK